MDGAEDKQVSDETRKFFSNPLEIKIELQKVGDDTRITVATRKRGKPWAQVLSTVAEKVKIHTDTPLKIEPYTGDDHRHSV